MKKILITEGAGFVGSHLCDRLLKEGDEVEYEKKRSIFFSCSSFGVAIIIL
jgi:UDP-glucose 4-epimerase